MGSGSSTFRGPIKAPPIIREQEPPIPGVVSFGLGDAQGCEWKGHGECRLTVGAGLSSSGAKLYRDQGSVTEAECSLFEADAKKVQNNQMAFEEFKTKARSGKYFTPLGNGYCAQYAPKSEEEMKKVTAPVWGERGGVWQDYTNPIAIRKMTAAGSYSSVTKLFIKPSIPFKVTFNGEVYTISLMTLFHPSPVRLENVQHDAMLTLGDPGAGNRAKGSGATDAVILVPLVGSLRAGPSGDFVSKIARYLSAVLQPDPVTGQYKTIDIPTGNDWDLSKLFPGTPSNGETVVTTGYYAWSGSTGMVKSTTPTIQTNPSPQADVWTYPYVPNGSTNVRYIMLKDPVPVNVFDLQTIRMLPATPAEQAIDSFVPSTLSFVTPKTCSTTPSGSSRESMTNPGETCDPFAGVQSNAFSKDTLVQVIIGALTTFGVLLAIYFAVKLFANSDWGFKLPRWGHLFGNYVINAPLSKEEKIPAGTAFTSREVEEMGERAEARVSAIKPSIENPLLKARKAPAVKPEDVTLTEEETKKKAEEAAAAIEAARVEAEAEAKRKADEEARLIEQARVEAEEEAKKKAEEEARLIEEARLEAEADAERARREAQERVPLPSEEESQRLREIGPAGTGLFSGQELEDARKAEEEAKQKEAEEEAKRKEAEEEAKRKEAETEMMRANVKKMLADAKAAAERKKAAEEEAKKAEEEAIQASEPKPDTRTNFARTVVAPPPIIADALKAREEADKAAKEAAETAAAAEAVAAEPPKPPAKLKRRKVESSVRELPVASETKVTPSTGEVKKVEDPKNVLGDYEALVAQYEASPSKDTEQKLKGLDSRARAVVMNSPALKERYAGLTLRLERAKNAYETEQAKAAQRSEGSLQKRIDTLQKHIDEVRFTRSMIAKQQMQKLPILVLRSSERNVQGRLERLLATIASTEANLKTLEDPRDRLILEKKVKDAKAFYATEKKASDANVIALKQAQQTQYDLKDGGRRRKMKRKSTRRYVA